MSTPDGIRLAIANVAGGRLTQAGGYDWADRTDAFAAVIAAQRPDLLVVTELNCDGDQLDRLAAAAMPGRPVHTVRHDWSDSHIPGVRRLGVGIASAYPVEELDRIDLPDPPFEMLHWRTGDRYEWHRKGFLVARMGIGELGRVDVIGGQLHPVHMARSADGVEYSYETEPGRSFGAATAAALREGLAARGVERALLAGDLNMPDPGTVLADIVRGRVLVDGFGDHAPATTPDGRSIDRAFVTNDLVATGAAVAPVPGADHFVCTFQITRRWLGPEQSVRSLHQDPSRDGARGRGPQAGPQRDQHQAPTR